MLVLAIDSSSQSASVLFIRDDQFLDLNIEENFRTIEVKQNVNISN